MIERYETIPPSVIHPLIQQRLENLISNIDKLYDNSNRDAVEEIQDNSTTNKNITIIEHRQKLIQLQQECKLEYLEVKRLFDSCINFTEMEQLLLRLENFTTAIKALFSLGINPRIDPVEQRLIDVALHIRQLGNSGNFHAIVKKIQHGTISNYPIVVTKPADKLIALRNVFTLEYLGIMNSWQNNQFTKKDEQKLMRLEKLTEATQDLLSTMSKSTCTDRLDGIKERYNHINQFEKSALQLSTTQKIVVAVLAFTTALLGATLGLVVGFFTGCPMIGGGTGAIVGASGGAYLARIGFFKFSHTNYNKELSLYADSFKDLVKDEQKIERSC
ncbi:MAG TPA: hypothetical protein VJN02_05870 [Gammaproteobacteria bacterium]|nr:hypothetical protein [Gammaproteobacteria bacterium]